MFKLFFPVLFFLLFIIVVFVLISEIRNDSQNTSTQPIKPLWGIMNIGNTIPVWKVQHDTGDQWEMIILDKNNHPHDYSTIYSGSYLQSPEKLADCLNWKVDIEVNDQVHEFLLKRDPDISDSQGQEAHFTLYLPKNSEIQGGKFKINKNQDVQSMVLN